ncbi:hypothetical protein G7Y89_g14063 [Cudoniella acicularis]|uniref:Uncharacterized protein n=1 Tax=Cudoniella acicularis TaxID=354080 RepID=A0A8H4R624_9HELO|nr:hypothetical protein G7Y89_g14063 [Cudoniella acicularis]
MDITSAFKTATRQNSKLYGNVEYDPLTENNDETPSEKFDPPSQSRRRKRPGLLLGLSILSIIISAMIISFGWVKLETLSASLKDAVHEIHETKHLLKQEKHYDHASKPKAPTGLELGHCGNSNEEARALGCKFDPMTWAWMRPECYREELISDFLNRTDWHFYLHDTLLPEEEIPIEEWLRGDYYELWTPKKYHFFHCTYMWRKVHLALLEHLPMDSDTIKMDHTIHCEMAVTHDIYPVEHYECDDWPGACPTLVQAGWTKCGWY